MNLIILSLIKGLGLGLRAAGTNLLDWGLGLRAAGTKVSDFIKIKMNQKWWSAPSQGLVRAGSGAPATIDTVHKHFYITDSYDYNFEFPARVIIVTFTLVIWFQIRVMYMYHVHDVFFMMDMSIEWWQVQIEFKKWREKWCESFDFICIVVVGWEPESSRVCM